MIPSLLQIPSAVSDSKLHSVLPNNGKGDFQFERSTGATRINKDGLIEEVGYFSSELVQNGNFSELGPELVTNGDFATDSDWNLGAGWSINNGKAVAENAGSPTAATIAQSGYSLIIGKTYKVVYTISDYVKGQVRPQFIGGGTSNLPNVSANGTYTEYFVAVNNSTTFRFRAATTDGGFTGKIDNVSVKQVDPNDRWETSSWWTFNSLGAYHPPTTDHKPLYQETCVVGKKYLITFDLNVIQGAAKFSIGSNTGSTTQVIATDLLSGSYRYEVTAAATHIIFNRNFTGTNNEYYVDNVSVVEVQGDRPRLSYDITNGVVDSQPHLLLENSSTNLFPFSEDYTQSDWVKYRITVTDNSSISPSGSTNAYKITEDTSNNTHLLQEGVTASASSTYTQSYFVKSNGRNFGIRSYDSTVSVVYLVKYDITNGSIISNTGGGTANIEDFGNGWFRCSLTYTTNASATAITSQPRLIDDSDNDSYLGDGVSGIYLWGAMMEQQSYATSYIKTAGTTITRAAETCNNSKPSVNSTEGVLYCEIAALADDLTFRTISVSDGTTSNRSVLRYGGTSNFINVLASSGGSNVFDNNFTLLEITDFNKIAIKYKANDFALWVNGNEVKTDTSGAVPVGLSQVQFSNAVGNSNIFYGKVKGLAVYNEALTDAQLIELTS